MMALRCVAFDSREPSWVQKLPMGVPTAVCDLPVGDAWLTLEQGVVVVERKSGADLMASIADGRLLAQASQMAAACDWCNVIVSGVIIGGDGVVRADGKATKWQWRSIAGALMTVQQLGVAVSWIPSDTEYGPTLRWLANREYAPVTVKLWRREAVMQSPQEAILCALPGISDTRAAALLESCGSAAWALDFLTGTSKFDVPGIGPGTKRAARQALGLYDDLALTVVAQKGEIINNVDQSDE